MQRRTVVLTSSSFYLPKIALNFLGLNRLFWFFLIIRFCKYIYIYLRNFVVYSRKTKSFLKFFNEFDVVKMLQMLFFHINVVSPAIFSWNFWFIFAFIDQNYKKYLQKFCNQLNCLWMLMTCNTGRQARIT